MHLTAVINKFAFAIITAFFSLLWGVDEVSVNRQHVQKPETGIFKTAVRAGLSDTG
jgi:hypothetical protein